MTTKNTSKFRTESDLLGSKEVPEEALYGVQTTRAIENFHISGNLSWVINAVNTSSARPTMW
jgi:aspartate ammonia-lyase